MNSSIQQRPQIESICIVVPTYNEAANIPRLLKELQALFSAKSWPALQVLVVDDESADGTADVVREFAREDHRIELLSGKKEGLGSAYTRGFQHVLDHYEVDAIVQMDADYSHAPSDVRRLVNALRDADVIVGSRYVVGGGVDRAWGLRRRLLSRFGNLFARYVAGMYRIADCTAGFKAIRVASLRRAFPLRLSVQGYVFQVASLHAMMISGATIREVPIRFADRTLGETKLGLNDVAEFLLHVWWLRLLSRKTFIKFALTGATGVVVNLGCFQSLLYLGSNPYLASAVAIEISIIWNFFLNNFWTFRDRQIASRKRVRGLKFNAVSLVTLGVSFSTFVALRWLYPEQAAWVAQTISILPAAMANYFANSYWTFRADS